MLRAPSTQVGTSHTENVRSDKFAIFLLVVQSTNKLSYNPKTSRHNCFFSGRFTHRHSNSQQQWTPQLSLLFPVTSRAPPRLLSRTYHTYQVSNNEIVQCYHWTTLQLIWVTQAGVVVVVIDTCLPYHFCASNTRRPPPPSPVPSVFALSYGTIVFYGDSLQPQRTCSIRASASSLFFCFQRCHVQLCTITTACAPWAVYIIFWF